MKRNRTVIILAIVFIVIVGDILLLYNISPNKRNLKKLRDAMDIESPVTRKFALQLASTYEGAYSIDQICEVYNHINKNWKYVSDPRGLDYFSKASLTIESDLAGDCDDFAILIATVIESIGGRTRISIAKNELGAHVFAEVYFEDDPQKLCDRINYHFQGLFEYIFDISKVKKINYRTDQLKGYWLNLDYTSKYPGGSYYEYTSCTIFYPKENYYTTE